MNVREAHSDLKHILRRWISLICRINVQIEHAIKFCYSNEVITITITW